MTRRRRAGLGALALAALTAGCSGSTEPGVVVARQVADGEIVWERDTEPAPIALLVDRDQIVTVGARGCAGASRLTMLDATGEPQWSRDVRGGFGPRQVALVGDSVVHAGGDGVRAFAAEDGATRWDLGAVDGVEQLVVGAGASLVLGVYDWEAPTRVSTIQSLDVADGSVRWETALDGLGQVVDLALTDDLALVQLIGTGPIDALEARVVAVELDDGAVRWQRDLGPSEIAMPILLADDHVVVTLLNVAEPRSASVVVLGVAAGDERWRIDRAPASPEEAAAGLTALATDPSLVLVRDGDRLVALEAATGDERWVEPGFAGGAWFVDGLTLAVPSPWIDGRATELVALDPATGESLWTAPTEGATAQAVGLDGVAITSTYGQQPSCD